MRLNFERAPRGDIKNLHPAYFAMVMATGIVALGAHEHGFLVLATALFWCNVLFLVALTTTFIARAVIHKAAFLADISSHSRGVGFFTIPAAAAVFGVQLIVQMNALALATAFLAVAALLLVAITYAVLTVLTVKKEKPTIAEGLNGGWLVSIVAMQAVSRLIVMVASEIGRADDAQMLMFIALALWLAGGALYLWIMTGIFFRYTFLPMAPADLTPPYWISMGAVAISTLAGATLLEHAALSPVVLDILPFIKGFTLFFWSVGSWWIPMLLLLGVWRYVLRGTPFKYDPLYWGGVFPLGMYSVATHHLVFTLDAPFLAPLSQFFLGVAVVAWVAAFIGLVHSLAPRRARALNPQTETDTTR